LDELIEKGFIDVEATGMGVQKVTTLYGVSDRWRDYATAAFRQAKRPEPSIANPGFRRGNKLWRKACQNNTSVENAHGAVRESEHGGAMTVRVLAHGEEGTVLHKGRENKRLSPEIAQITAVCENDTVL